MEKSRKSDLEEEALRYIALLTTSDNRDWRISDVWEMLRICMGLEEFDLMDFHMIRNGEFESYLLDKLILWKSDEIINIDEIAESIMGTGDFSSTEKLLLEDSEINYMIWAILYCL